MVGWVFPARATVGRPNHAYADSQTGNLVVACVVRGAARREAPVPPPVNACDSCGAAVSAGAAFCRSCGASVAREEPTPAADPAASHVCVGCGLPITDATRFCRSCGTDQLSQPRPDASTERLHAEYASAPAAAGAGAAPQARAPTASCEVCGGPVRGSERLCRSCDELQYAAEPVPAPAAAAHVPGMPPASTAPPRAPNGDTTRSRKIGLLGLVVAVVLVFGAAGGAAAYFAFLKPDGGDRSAKISSGSIGPPDGGDQAGDDRGVTTATDAPPRGGSGALPPVSRSEMESDITRLLSTFHQAIVEERFEHAWDLLSDRKRAQVQREEGFASWRRAQASLTPHLDPDNLSATIEQLQTDDAGARVMVRGMEWSKPGSSCSEWSGLTWVKYENGQWRYDPGYSTTPERQRAWKDRYEQLLGAAC